MRPTLEAGDWVLAWPTAAPGVGEIVLADLGGRMIVKRVAGWHRGRVVLGVEMPYGTLPEEAIVARVVLVLKQDPLRLMIPARS